MTSKGKNSDFQDFGEPEDLSRAELQKALKLWGLPSGGTNAAIRDRYRLFRNSKICNTAIVSGNKKSESSQPSSSSKSSGGGGDDADADVDKPTKKKAAAAAPEKRLKRYRSSCPNNVYQRIQRARTQRMFLVKKGDIQQDGDSLSCEFVVLGSTGNVYNVTIQKIGHCTCPDHQKGNLCKHILFVLLKVMAIDPSSELIYQAAWLGSELKEMFEQMNRRYQQVSGAVLANSKVQETFAKLEKGEDADDEQDANAARRKSVQEDDDCPICFDTLQQGGDKITFCRARCGANFHHLCIENWLKQNRAKPTCPMCREAWDDGKSTDNNNKEEGFTNLGRLQGQSTVRDTSTYSEWFQSPIANRKRRRWY